jgi:hypothetical protein
MSYNIESGGGGNCTRVLLFASRCPICVYDMIGSGWPEHGREDVALRELVASWHSLTPFVRANIVDLPRSR